MGGGWCGDEEERAKRPFDGGLQNDTLRNEKGSVDVATVSVVWLDWARILGAIPEFTLRFHFHSGATARPQ